MVSIASTHDRSASGHNSRFSPTARCGQVAHPQDIRNWGGEAALAHFVTQQVQQADYVTLKYCSLDEYVYLFGLGLLMDRMEREIDDGGHRAGRRTLK